MKPSSEIDALTKEVEQKNTLLEETKHYFEYILARVPGCVYWLDTNNIYLGCNNTLSDLLGLSSNQEIIGKTNNDLPWKEHASDLDAFNNKVMGSKKAHKEEEVVNIQGKKRVYISEKVPIFDKSQTVVGLVGISIDITELKEIQEKLSKAEVIAEKEQEMRKTVMMLVGDIVHDLTTPISTIYTDASTLGELAPELKEVIKEARELKSEKLKLIDVAQLDYVLNKMSASQIDSVRTINDFIKATLRELSVAQKYQDGAIAFEELNKCSIRRVLENVMEGYPRHGKLIINQCFPYGFIFMGNSILMMKVLFNLIKNAEEQIIANGKGEITITTKESGDKNILIIKDTAGGASPEVVENLFKDFFTTKKDGTGIGLAFCKKIMHNFDGDITCHSNFGESIEFILSFPKVTNSNTPANTPAN